MQFTDPEQKGQNKVSPDPINFSFMNEPYGRSGNIPAELQQSVDSRKLVFRMKINVEGSPATFQSMKKDTILI